MEVRFYNDINQFYKLAFPFLMEREIENSLFIYILNRLKENIKRYGEEFPRLSLIFDNNTIVVLAMRTPPNDLLLSFSNNLDYIETLVEEYTYTTENLPGVLGFKAAADKFTKLWSENNNLTFRLLRNERLYILRKVSKDTLGSNPLLVVTNRYDSLVLKWARNMITEALEETSKDELSRALKNIHEEIMAGTSQIYLLFNKGEPVSMARKAGKIPNGNAINLVYTPPSLRRKGYATECVAKLSQLILDEGMKYCFLFTDLSNPTSNNIYQKIGYRPIDDLTHYKFLLTS
jgi:predicted GNAT family acetyltransferase